MPVLLKYLARHLVMGVVAGWITLAFLIATNTGGLSDVVFGAANSVLPIVILAFGFTITFGSLAMGASIMMLPSEDDGATGRGLKVHTWLASFRALLPQGHIRGSFVPVPVKDKGQRNQVINTVQNRL